MFTDPWLSRAFPYVLYNYVSDPTRLAKIIVQGKKSLFPNGHPAESPPDPTPEEQVVLRERLEARLITLLPCEHCLLGAVMSTERFTSHSYFFVVGT